MLRVVVVLFTLGINLSVQADDVNPFFNVSCSSDGEYYAGAHHTNQIFIRNIRSGDVSSAFKLDSKDIYSRDRSDARPLVYGSRFQSLDFRPNTHYLMTGTNNGKGDLWDIDKDKKISHISDFRSGPVNSELRYSQSGKYLVSIYADKFKAYDGITLEPLYEKKGDKVNGIGYQYTSLTINEALNLIAIGGTRYLHLYNLKDGSLKKVIEYPEYIMDVEFSHNGELLAFQNAGVINLWNIQSDMLEFTVKPPKGLNGGFFGGVFSLDDSILYLAAVSNDGETGSLMPFDIQNKRWLPTIDTPGGSIKSLANCGQRYVITGHWRNRVNVVDVVSGKVIRTHKYTEKVEKKLF